ncbi:MULTISPECIES: hypothetical protein [Sphingomonas]|uniref:hypothetical protein n=1 Tax=Sphingomonas TaxID=13687 RepID=UPI001269B569|nr:MULTISPECIES: hypothetical protein [Sphingomonas]
MPLAPRFTLTLALVSTTAMAAGDLLPLKQGIYVPVGHACRGASNAEMVNYWGGRSSIGVAQAECSIARLVKRGNVYTLHDRCRDIQSGDMIEGGATVLTITSPTAFAMAGTRYRYCGARPTF